MCWCVCRFFGDVASNERKTTKMLAWNELKLKKLFLTAKDVVSVCERIRFLWDFHVIKISVLSRRLRLKEVLWLFAQQESLSFLSFRSTSYGWFTIPCVKQWISISSFTQHFANSCCCNFASTNFCLNAL